MTSAEEVRTLRAVLDAMPDFMVATEGPDLQVVAMSASVRALAERTDWLGVPLAQVYPELAHQGVLDLYDEVYRTGQPITLPAWRLQLAGPDGAVTELHVHWSAVPWQRPDGSLGGVLGTGYDVTEQVLAQQRAEAEAAESSRRYREATDVVRELQQALLPDSVPVLPRVDLAARYLVAGAEQAAGGDWFDVHALPGGRLALVVGDVVGHGVAAAAVMSRLRAVLAEALQTTPGPAAAVERLERYARTVPGARSATVVVVVLDPDTGTAEYVTRGHPAPLLVDSDGRGRQVLGSGGGPLGAGPGGPAQHTRLDRGDVLVLFSDGLVERADRPYPAGIDEFTRLAEAATTGQLWPAGTTSSAVQRICADAVELLTRRGHTDDVTVLAASLHAPVPSVHASAHPTAHGIADLRAGFDRWLTDVGCEPADRQALGLAVGEALDNAVEHGFRLAPTGTIVFSAELDDGGRVLVRVVDDGIWRTPGPGLGPRDRGLTVIGSLCEDLVVDGQPSGTTVGFARALTRSVLLGPSVAPDATPRPTPPPEEFRARLVGDPPVLHVRGPVDATTTGLLRTALAAVFHGDNAPVSIDLTDVTHLTSTGVAALADLLAAPGRDHPATLVAPTGSTAGYVLDLAGLPRAGSDPHTLAPQAGAGDDPGT